MHVMRIQLLLLILLDAGSPMMWFGLFHLLIGNFLIGVFETIVAKRHYKLQVRYRWIILANYLSMFFGMYFIAPWASGLAGNTDFWGGQTAYGEYKLYGFFIGLSVSFVVTLIIETPFYAIVKGKRPSFLTILKVSFFANVASYIGMIIVYSLINVPGSVWK